MGDIGTQDKAYDFIVVGGGTAGCVVASSLAKSKSAPRVLLVEAGGDNKDPTWRVHGNFVTQKENVPQNWSYRSSPIASANNREIVLDRGKGLGGSTAINYTYWTRGSRDEWDEMARLTGDDAWKWENTAERYRQLENYHHDVVPNSGAEEYYNPAPGAYGTEGQLHICSPRGEWKKDMAETTEVWKSRGYRVNPDSSDGDTIGLIVFPMTGKDEVRSTSADLLLNSPSNLAILVDAPVHRILFNGTQAKGIRLIDGREYTATREVILSAGSVDSPKILLHSGIGPSKPLAELAIPLIHENPHVGQDMRDHYHIELFFPARPDCRSRAAPPNGGHGMGFFKSDAVYASPEFAALPEVVQRRLRLPTVPVWEMVHRGNGNIPLFGKGVGCVSLIVFLMNSQGRGEVTLASADPSAAPLLRVAYLEHPFDQRVAVEATRETMRVAFHEGTSVDVNAKGHICPKSESEEDILAFWREKLTTTWHLAGSCKIGKSQEGDDAVVDPSFKLFGVQGVRVADLSVVPLLPCAHTQSFAYQVGMIAAAKIIEEHGLDR